MGIMRIMLVCIGIAVCMESAYAGCSFKPKLTWKGIKWTWVCSWSGSGGISWGGKRSVDTPNSEAKDREMIDSIMNNATIEAFIMAADDNRDGCLDAAEWINHDGRVPEFCTFLDSYDANGDDCLTVEEVMTVAVTAELEEFMNVPMLEYNDMMMKIEGMEDEEGMEDDEGTGGKGRKAPE